MSKPPDYIGMFTNLVGREVCIDLREVYCVDEIEVETETKLGSKVMKPITVVRTAGGDMVPIRTDLDIVRKQWLKVKLNDN